MQRLLRLCACTLAVLALAGARDGIAAEIPSIRVAVTGAPTQPLNVLFSDAGIQRKIATNYGKTYVVALNRVTATPIAAQLFATGQIDIAMLAPTTILNMIRQGIVQKSDLQIVAAGITDGFDGSASTFWAALKKSNISRSSDLRNKIIALNGFGTASDAALRTMLGRAQLDPDRDVKLVELAFPNMQTALEQGRVDVAQFTVPFSAQLRELDNSIEIFSFVEAFNGPSYSTVALVNKSVAKRLGGSLRDYLADLSRGMHWLQDPANREAALDLATSATSIPRPFLSKYYLTKADQGSDPDLCVRAAWLQAPLDRMREVSTDIDLSSLIDRSYLPEDGRNCK